MKFNIMLILTMTITIINAQIFADKSTDVTLYSTVYTSHMMSNTVLMQTNQWTNNGQVAAHIIATPALNFEDNFQPDARLDTYISTGFDTNAINISIRSAYIDLLFYDMISLKTGFMRIDYGYNSYFHPMNLIEFVPEIRDLYNKIYIGNQDMGYKGIPSARLNIALPEFIDKLKINLDQSMVWIGFNSISDNYFLSSISCAYLNYSLNYVLGYSGNSWSSDTNKRLPVNGLSMSAVLPFDIIFFMEGLYKNESYRPYVSSDGNYTDKRSGSDFYNVSFRFQTIKTEPVFNNNISFSIEYFSYGEGLSHGMYDDTYNFLKNPSNAYHYGQNLIISERNFKNYITTDITYTIKNSFLSFDYFFLNEMDSGVMKHQFTIDKTYDKVDIGGSIIYMQASDERYELYYGAMDLSLYFYMSMNI